MAHIIRENAGKKTKTISELFTNNIFEFTFVSIFADMTILTEGQNIKIFLRLSINTLRTQVLSTVPDLTEY